jgi:hypothetical protein
MKESATIMIPRLNIPEERAVKEEKGAVRAVERRSAKERATEKLMEDVREGGELYRRHSELFESSKQGEAVKLTKKEASLCMLYLVHVKKMADCPPPTASAIHIPGVTLLPNSLTSSGWYGDVTTWEPSGEEGVEKRKAPAVPCQGSAGRNRLRPTVSAAELRLQDKWMEKHVKVHMDAPLKVNHKKNNYTTLVEESGRALGYKLRITIGMMEGHVERKLEGKVRKQKGPGYKSMKVGMLKELCSQRGLELTGIKDTLVERLFGYDKEVAGGGGGVDAGGGGEEVGEEGGV